MSHCSEKRVSQLGEHVGFAKAQGPKGYWAAMVAHLEKTHSAPLRENWELRGPATPVFVAAGDDGRSRNIPKGDSGKHQHSSDGAM